MEQIAQYYVLSFVYENLHLYLSYNGKDPLSHFAIIDLDQRIIFIIAIYFINWHMPLFIILD